MSSLYPDLSLAPRRLRDDFDTVYDAVRYNGLNLQYVSAELQGNGDIVPDAVQSNAAAILYASARIQNRIRAANTGGIVRTVRIDATDNTDDNSNFNSMRRHTAF